MEVSVRQDVTLPKAELFDRLTRFDAILVRMVRHNAALERLDHPAPPGVGTQWRGRLELHGLHRDCEARLVSMTPPDGFRIEGTCDGVSAVLEVRLDPLSPDLTALKLDIRLTPTSLRGRLLVNSLRLVKGRIQKRLADRVARFAREIGRPTAGSQPGVS